MGRKLRSDFSRKSRVSGPSAAKGVKFFSRAAGPLSEDAIVRKARANYNKPSRTGEPRCARPVGTGKARVDVGCTRLPLYQHGHTEVRVI